MIELDSLTSGTTTLGHSASSDCADPDIEARARRFYAKILHHAKDLVPSRCRSRPDYGIPIVNKRIATTPIALVAAASNARDLTTLRPRDGRRGLGRRRRLHRRFSGLRPKGFKRTPIRALDPIRSRTRSAETEHVCASSRSRARAPGSTMDAGPIRGGDPRRPPTRPRPRGDRLREARRLLQRGRGHTPSSRRAPRSGEAETVLNVGVLRPVAVAPRSRACPGRGPPRVAETVKRTAFNITRMASSSGARPRAASDSFASSTSASRRRPRGGGLRRGHPRARRRRAHGRAGHDAALALLTDAVKKGAHGLRRASAGSPAPFIPVSDDAA
jgi:uncharacterized protein (UPF0210 family)